MSRHDEVEQQARYAGLTVWASNDPTGGDRHAFDFYRGKDHLKIVVGTRGALLWLSGYLAGKQAP